MNIRLIIIGFEIIAGGVLVAVISMIMGRDPITLARRGLSAVRVSLEIAALLIMSATLPAPHKATRKIGRHRRAYRSRFIAVG